MRHTPAQDHWPRFSLRPLAAALCTLIGAAAFAQTPARAPLEPQIDEAFRQVLQSKGRPDSLTRYATLLVEAGNYEGGVAALESLLLLPDPPPGVRLDLAILYYRMESYAVAEAYFREALAQPDLPPEQRTLAEQLLKDTVKRLQTNRLSGYAQAGVRAQSNPNARTDSAQVLAGGSLVGVDPVYRPNSDTDVQLTLGLNHELDLGLQNEATVVSTLVAQVVKFSSSSGSTPRAGQVDPYNLTVAEVTTGLRFRPVADAGSGLRLRPHLIASTLSAQGKNFLNTAGVGLGVTQRYTERTLLEAHYEVREFRYANRVDLPQSRELEGPQNLLRVRLSRELGPGRVLVGEVIGFAQRTERAFYDNDSLEARVTYSASYGSPLAQLPGTWTTLLSGSVQDRRYGAPDPAVDATVRRDDTQWRVGLTQILPLAEQWSLLMQLEWTRNRSNQPNFRYSNRSLLAAVNYQF